MCQMSASSFSCGMWSVECAGNSDKKRQSQLAALEFTATKMGVYRK
jgi:hypothetical protein